MKKEEKRLLEKIRNNYLSPTEVINFTNAENKTIDRFIVGGILNKEAFSDVTAHPDTHKKYKQAIAYPLTPLGEAEINKNWYLNFRNNLWVVIIRDAITAIAFLASLYLTLSKIFTTNP